MWSRLFFRGGHHTLLRVEVHPKGLSVPTLLHPVTNPWSLHSCVSAPGVNMSALWLCTILLAALSCSARPNMPPGKKHYVLHTSRLCFLPQNIIHTGLSTNRLKYFTWTIQLCLPKNLKYSDL